MKKVSLVGCAEYDPDAVYESITSSLNNIGFDLSRFNGKKVGLKANLLMPFKPERAVITHPEFFRAAAQIVLDAGGIPVLTECPNFVSLQNTIKRVGYDRIVEELGIAVADMDPTAFLVNENARLYKKLEISQAFFDVDMIVSLPKLKSHAFTHYTGAVKNLFGTIPGIRKSRMHSRVPSQGEFADFLLDLYGGLKDSFEPKKPFLHIMDGILGMEGEGPGPSGTPKQIGVILASEDAVALDWAAVNLVGLDMDKVLTVTKGFERSIGVSGPEEIELVGEPMEKLAVTDFVPSKHAIFGGVGWPVTSPTFKGFFVEKPVPQADKCVLCYQCKRTCPAGAISEACDGGKVPVFDYKKCIRCFCCMEICPEAALVSKKGSLQFLLGKKYG